MRLGEQTELRFFDGYGAGVTGQEFSSKINDELTLFAYNSGLQALQKCQPKTRPASRSASASR
jgi:hypothetical protein